MNFVAPTIQWAALTPLLIIFGAAVAGVLVETFLPRPLRRPTQIGLGLVALASATVAVVWRWTLVAASGPQPIVYLGQREAALSSVVEDGPALAAQAVLLVVAFVALLVVADRSSGGEDAFAPSGATAPGSFEEERAAKAGFEQTEVFPLVMFSVLGMMVFTQAADFVTLFIALEVLSLPLYVLSGVARRRRLLSQEASLKYFLLGAMSSAIFLFGIVLLYGFSGSFNFQVIAAAIPQVSGQDTLLVAGMILVLVGLLFKVGAVPFHAWAPDVYQGAPTPITGFMAAATKIAAFAALLRFFYIVGPGLIWDLREILWVIIGATMLLGTVLGLVQRNIKRMLAYSSIAHAGFVLLGVVALQVDAPRHVLFYLLAYGLATVGAFGVVALVRERDKQGRVTSEAQDIDQWKGLGKRSGLLAGSMTIFLLSFAGLPLTAGFIGKFVVFGSALRGGLAVLVVLAIICSVITAFFYFRLVVHMFFHEPSERSAEAVAGEGLGTVAIVLAAAGVVVLGVLPGPILDVLGVAIPFLP